MGRGGTRPEAVVLSLVVRRIGPVARSVGGVAVTGVAGLLFDFPRPNRPRKPVGVALLVLGTGGGARETGVGLL